MSPSSRAANCFLLGGQFSSDHYLYCVADLYKGGANGKGLRISFSVCRPRHSTAVDLCLLRPHLAS